MLHPARRTLFFTQAAVLVAVAIAVRRILTPQLIPGLSLGGLPIVLSGLLLGPGGGALVGAVSDVVGWFVGSPWPYHPFYTVTAALTGALPPLVMAGLSRIPRVPVVVRMTVAIFVGQTVTKVGMIPFFDHYLSGLPVWAVAVNNLIVETWHAPLYAVLCRSVLKGLRDPGVAAGAMSRDP